MREVQASEAKAKFAELLDRVEQGESVVITRHGKAVASLVPHGQDSDSKARQAMRELMELRKGAGRVTREEILAWRDEGRK